MSIVSNYVLLPHSNDEDKLDELNKAMNTQDYQRGFRCVDDDAGGTKCLEADVWTAALNMCALEDMVEIIQSITWSEPEALILIHCGQNEIEWSSIPIFEEKHSS